MCVDMSACIDLNSNFGTKCFKLTDSQFACWKLLYKKHLLKGHPPGERSKHTAWARSKVRAWSKRRDLFLGRN